MNIRKFLSALIAFLPIALMAQYTVTTDAGIISLIPIADNAVRVKLQKPIEYEQQELIYVTPDTSVQATFDSQAMRLSMPRMSVTFNPETQALAFYNSAGEMVLEEMPNGRCIVPAKAQEMDTWQSSQKFVSPTDEYLYGTGQFQDGHLNVKGLTRRLTQVNTQISLPMILSNKGYALLWNNYGLVDFNPADNILELVPSESESTSILVNATSTAGNKQERRNIHAFEGALTVPETADYCLLLDVGQTMARKQKLSVDGECIIDFNNIWLPPTAAAIVPLLAGEHQIVVEGEEHDQPKIYWRKVEDQTEFRSPVSQGIDYTVFVGDADEAIAAFRQVTGEVPPMPEWMFGYIHCRERYHNQAELLENAREFHQRQIPVDVIVQDWQWWGKNGWNAMEFDEDKYPDPAAMVQELHDMDMKLMISVWAKIDKNSKLGKVVEEKGYYIPGSDWIDFFNPEAAKFYTDNQNQKLMLPYHIDAWWQDATEPENDDIAGRRINNGALPGEIYRNAYPLFVNKCVYSGFKETDPDYPIAILTRSGFPGIQRYGVVTWSGDVGYDLETLGRQIVGGLGQMATGLPWWTFDAGGFFRPEDQYTNAEYHEIFSRWLQVATFSPFMRVHGYISQTEPWRYGPEVEAIARKYIDLRYQLKPYILECAERVSKEGYTMMRPLVMDFPDDEEALQQKHEYMFGPKYLVAPVLELGATQWEVYLPAGSEWTDFWTGEKHDGGQYITVAVPVDIIPVFTRN